MPRFLTSMIYQLTMLRSSRQICRSFSLCRLAGSSLLGLTLGTITLVGLGSAGPLRPSVATPLGPEVLAQASQEAIAAAVLTLVNGERQRVGARPLALNTRLTAAAQGHAQDMANGRFLSHTGSNGSSMADRVNATGYGWSALGENVAMGQQTPAAVMTSWMGSNGHRRNILNANFTEIGIGYAEGGGRPYWVQVFGRPR